MKNCKKRRYNIKISMGIIIAVIAVLIGIGGFQRNEAMAAYRMQDPLQPSIASKLCGFMCWQTVIPKKIRN